MAAPLLLGATGFLGRGLLYALQERGAPSLVTVRAKRAATAQQRFEALRREFPLVELFDGRQSVSVVVNCAASVSFVGCYDENVALCEEAIRLARRLSCRLVHVSTAYVGGLYPFDVLGPELPDSRARDTNDYVASKAKCEELCLAARAEGLRCAIFRPAIITPAESVPRPGWYTGSIGVVAVICGALLRVRPIVLHPGRVLNVVPVDVASRELASVVFDAGAATTINAACWRLPTAALANAALHTFGFDYFERACLPRWLLSVYFDAKVRSMGQSKLDNLRVLDEYERSLYRVDSAIGIESSRASEYSRLLVRSVVQRLWSSKLLCLSSFEPSAFSCAWDRSPSFATARAVVKAVAVRRQLYRLHGCRPPVLEIRDASNLHLLSSRPFTVSISGAYPVPAAIDSVRFVFLADRRLGFYGDLELVDGAPSSARLRPPGAARPQLEVTIRTSEEWGEERAHLALTRIGAYEALGASAAG